ncbi:MAG TPA: type I polyketide synthase, partial [Verrucomicrobiae bacterium]|nr:type I polyketide synthase [Verrucomicrobiae bacterium]
LAHTALEDAGCDPERYTGRIGVFCGSAMNTYFASSGQNAKFAEDYIPTLIVNDKDFLSTRLSYKLGLRGPSMTIQSACSTSLVAIHLACQSLLNGESDAVLAGAVSVRVPHRTGYFYDAGGVVSPDGHVRAFDAGANGTVFGSGGGVVVLKRLEDALKEGDSIYAVIKGSAVNNDGSAKAGYTAPSVNGQADVIVEALANAKVGAETITFVEAHGSGTPVGDSIELLALTKAFRNFTTKSGFCALGSVKTNVGHLDAAAGMAGLIKTALALKNHRLPPSLHYTKPNPEIDFAASPFHMSTRATEWASTGGPRRAGVSATGMGGTNAHVILEEAPMATRNGVTDQPGLFLLSAKNASALDTLSKNLAEFLTGPANDSARKGAATATMASITSESATPRAGLLGDAAYTLLAGRRRYACRRFVVGSRVEEVSDALKTADARRTLIGAKQDGAGRPVVFLLPGMGDHYPGMGEGLYKQFDIYRQEVDRCAKLLLPLAGVDVRELLFPPRPAGEPTKARGIDLKRMLGKSTAEAPDPAAERLNQTVSSQIAQFTVEYSLAQLWQHWGLRPDRLVGHSLGEYVAACLAGVFSLEDALKLVVARAKLVQALPAGAMLAVMLSEEKLHPLLGENLSLSLINGPELCVVAGLPDAVAELQSRLEAQEIVCRPVRNTHAFHSRMLDPITEAFAGEVRKVRLNAPRIPFISNVTGTWITPAQATDPGYWVDHARLTARFSDALAELWKISGCLPLEVGPGRTLGVLAMQHPARQTATNPVVFSSLRHDYENQPDSEFILNTVGRLWLDGVEMDWEKLTPRSHARKISLPPYPFERRRHWIDSRPAPQLPAAAPASTAHKPDLADWFYTPTWERTSFRTVAPGSLDDGIGWLVLGEASDLSSHLMATLAEKGDHAVLALFGDKFALRPAGTHEIRPGERSDYAQLLGTLNTSRLKTLHIIHLGALSRRIKPLAAGYDEVSQELGFHSLLTLAQAIGELDVNWTIRIGVITSQIHEVTGEENLNPATATALGPCGVMPKEYPNITSFSVDLPALPRKGKLLARMATQLLGEFEGPVKGGVIAYRGAYRWERGFKTQKLPASNPVVSEENLRVRALRPRGVYLITGGTGGIGLAVARHLAKTCQARLVLTRRTPFPDKPAWRERAAAGDLPEAERQIIASLLEIEAQGGEVEVFPCEATDRAGMQRVIAKTIKRHKTIHGVIHAAGIIQDGMMQLKTKETADLVLAPKVKGTLTLYELVRGLDLDILVLFSSISSVVALHGQSDYVGANAFLDEFAHYANSRESFRTVVINWPGWREVGILANLKTPSGFETQKAAMLEKAILTKDGLDAFDRALAARLTQLIVSPRDLSVVIDEERAPS